MDVRAETLCDLASPAAGWRDQLHEEFALLGRSLQSAIDVTVAAARHRAYRQLADGGPEALSVAGRHLGDALRQLEHDVEGALVDGAEAILHRTALTLDARGFELDVTCIRRPRRREAHETVVARAVPDLLLALAGRAGVGLADAMRLLAGSARVAGKDMAADVDQCRARARILMEAGVEAQIIGRRQLAGAGRPGVGTLTGA
jgi:hypothetical protein